MSPVLISGGGVAASTVARLLGSPIPSAERARVPAILLSEATQALISDIFGKKDLFSGSQRIRRRTVTWGEQPAVTLPHEAVVVSEEQLLERIRPEASGGDGSADWTIFTSRPPAGNEHRFGTRRAAAMRVELRDGSTCAIESAAAGWLFLVPDSERSGWLLSVGEASIEESRVIGAMVVNVGDAAGEFAAYPRIVWPLAAAGWLACGSAAMGFDPICGDGTGHAIREAILAAAVVRAAAKGGDVDSLVSHYGARLRLGFKRHLLLCRDFYRTGGQGSWWRSELAAIEDGIRWCGAEPRFEYQLAGFELRRICGG